MRKNNIKNVLIIFDGINLFNLQFIIFGKIFGYKVILDIVEDKIHSSEKMSVVAKFHIRVSEIILPYFGWLIDGVVVISTTLKKKYKLLFQKIDVELIPCSATNLDFSHKRKTNPEKEIIITYAGSFSQKDGVEYLIDAFCEISKNNKDLLLVLLGGSKKVIKDKVLLKNITNIEFVDYLPDADYWQKLSESDILCMTRIGSPYANAGFPFKLGEYLATGNPVVATDVSDISYYLKDKQDFVMAKASDTNSLISALEYLIKHPELRRKIGINGHNKCRKFFNPEINSQTLLRFVEKI